MIIVDIDSVLPHKELNENKRVKIKLKHCNYLNSCDKCKYYETLPKDCSHKYFLAHNYLVFGDCAYEITDKEKHIIAQLHKYCYGRKCDNCRYHRKIIHDIDGKKTLCVVERILAYRILHGKITQDQYTIVKGSEKI